MSKNYLYYVEGKCEEILIKCLKGKYFQHGKIKVFNVVKNELTTYHLRDLKKNSVLIFVFDIDSINSNLFNKNIELINNCSNVSRLILIPQVNNFEDEIIRATKINDIKKFCGSKSAKDFKRDFINIKNLQNKLEELEFNIDKFWINEDRDHKFRNESNFIKLKHK